MTRVVAAPSRAAPDRRGPEAVADQDGLSQSPPEGRRVLRTVPVVLSLIPPALVAGFATEAAFTAPDPGQGGRPERGPVAASIAPPSEGCWPPCAREGGVIVPGGSPALTRSTSA